LSSAPQADAIGLPWGPSWEPLPLPLPLLLSLPLPDGLLGAVGWLLKLELGLELSFWSRNQAAAVSA
jgi:hypothetical protein